MDHRELWAGGPAPDVVVSLSLEAVDSHKEWMRLDSIKVVLERLLEESAHNSVATDGTEVMERDVAHEAAVVRGSVADEASVDVEGGESTDVSRRDMTFFEA